MRVSAFVSPYFPRYLEPKGVDIYDYAMELAESGRDYWECEEVFADYIERLAIEFQHDAADYAESDITTMLVEDCLLREVVDMDLLFDRDGNPLKAGSRSRRAGSASKATKPRAKAPAKKASKPRSKGVRR